MNTLEEIIYKNTLKKKSMFLIGQTDSGKTWFITHSLIPYLNSKGISVQYFSNIDKTIDVNPETNLAIIDELETLQDVKNLEQEHPEDNPYYTTAYLKTIQSWFNNLKNIKNTCLYIITRNSKEDIDFLANSCHFTDWDNREIVTIVFFRDK